LPEVVIFLGPLTVEPPIFQAWLERLLDPAGLPQVATDVPGQAHCWVMVQELHSDLED
jgi:hypothetical protein